MFSVSTILPNSNGNENDKSSSRMMQFFTQAKIGTFLHQANICKEKGHSPRLIMEFIFALVLHGMGFSRALESERVPKDFEKDTVYAFLKNPTYNWRKFLANISSYLITKFLLPLTSEDRDRVLILDDSLFSRNCSKAVELLARVKDHTTNRYFREFRMLTLGWSDGASFMPLAFSLLSSRKEINRYQEIDPNIDKRTVSYQRRLEAMKKGTETMFDLLDSINPKKLGAKTVLFDSWFAYPAIISKIVKNYSLHVVCMIKRSPKIHYTYEGKSYTLNQLYKKVRKKRGRAKILANVVVGLGHYDENGNEIRARIVFVRDRNRSKKWLALLTTNLDHTEEDAVRIYGKRWEIECFFKVVKSNLRLAKEFQCRSYDSMTAHTSIVFLRYTMLSLSAREETDLRTIGQLFYVCCDEMEDIRFAQALMTILDILGATIAEEFLLTDEQINDFLDRFFEKLPNYLQKTMHLAGAA
ncbi:transposase [Virgibacillus sp. 179-BFC.A HS]|uniref:Transposase n=1 Tax=Tigheibacillus jepli TaxID=3035914 RepID=A0ABU5CK25_9BACI|nr:transposase [Virgibacillus sp. 179-BFC.A HS]MDY0406712.1 transposase [Virgibacillus sp. 179-BFC.A HS]